jgi:hypothetical protein
MKKLLWGIFNIINTTVILKKNTGQATGKVLRKM